MESSGLKSLEQEDAEEVPIKEELVEEVMRELYREIHHHHDHDSGSSSSAAKTASFPTETCGASVSESASTVMAGIDLVAKGMDDGDEKEEEDDGWLARVMSWGPQDLDFVF